jgi:hypothetical protein
MKKRKTLKKIRKRKQAMRNLHLTLFLLKSTPNNPFLFLAESPSMGW